MARRKAESALPAELESQNESTAMGSGAASPIDDAAEAMLQSGPSKDNLSRENLPTPNDENDESTRTAVVDPILDEVQAFLQRRRELAQRLREEIELTQQRLEGLQETLELLQGEMSIAEEREKKTKKPKVKSVKASGAGKEGREPRTRSLFDAPTRDGEGNQGDQVVAGELPNETTVD